MRTKRTLRNYLTSVLYTGLTLVIGLVVTPILIRELGEVRYGAFRALLDWFGYLHLLELGLGGALLALLAREWGKGDRSGLVRILGTGIRAYGWVALGMLAFGAIFVLASPSLVKVPREDAADLRAGAALLLLQLLWVPLTPFRLVTEASQQSYRVHGLLSIQSLLMTGLTVLFAFFGFGIRGQALATVLALAPMPVALALFWRRAQPGLSEAVGQARLGSPEGQALRKMNRDVLIFDAAGRVSLLTDTLLIAYFLEARQVVPFVVSTRIIQIAQGLLQGVGNASWAAMAEIHARGDLRKFNEKLVEITGIIAVLAFAAFLPIAIRNGEFVALWVGSSRYAGDGVSFVAALNAGLLAVISFWVWCFSGTGKVGRLIPTWIAWAVLNLGASVLFTKTAGIIGPLLGTLVSYVVVSAWRTPLLLRKVFGTPLKPLLSALLYPMALAIPYAALLILAARSYAPGWWVIAEIPLWATAFVGSAWVLLPRGAIKDAWRTRLRDSLRR
ncbi:MAG: hypothetical protein NDJ89_07810 [Oligoflexia bacterium]|nr:hypothetical protein [Oligoflexia bacterium]